MDVQTAIRYAGVLALVKDIVELQFQVHIFQFQLGRHIAKPHMAVLSSYVIVVILGCQSQRKCLRRSLTAI